MTALSKISNEIIAIELDYSVAQYQINTSSFQQMNC